jgi:probable HAF family extracellular repeat protein
LLAVPFSAPAGAAVGAEPAPPTVQQTDLGTLGGDSSEAVAISDNGQVVGSSVTAEGATRAFSWTAAGGMVDLGTLGGASFAGAVNDEGQVVGGSFLLDNTLHAFSWTAAEGMVDLGTLGGSWSSTADVNDRGQVVGSSATPSGDRHAFSWTAAGGMVDLGTLGGRSSDAVAVNENGQIVGNSELPTGAWQAFSWTPRGGMIDLGAPPGNGSFSNVVGLNDNGQVVGPDWLWTAAGGMVSLGAGCAQPVGINNSGQVAGTRRTADHWHACLWTPWGGTVDLGTLGTDSVASAISDGGMVVGWGKRVDGFVDPFSWTANGGMIDLGSLGGLWSYAFAVNDSGQVVGRSETTAGPPHAALWTVTTPFASLDASAVVAVPPGARNDTFVLNVGLTLGSASNGIAPGKEPVTLTLAGATLTLPPDSFGAGAHTYTFAGKLGGGRLVMTLRAVGAGSYRLTATGSGYDLPAARLPLSVQLTIGDDTGTTDAKAVIAPPPAR